MSSAAPKQPKPFPEPKRLLNQPAAHLLDSETYYTDGYLYRYKPTISHLSSIFFPLNDFFSCFFSIQLLQKLSPFGAAT